MVRKPLLPHPFMATPHHIFCTHCGRSWANPVHLQDPDKPSRLPAALQDLLTRRGIAAGPVRQVGAP